MCVSWWYTVVVCTLMTCCVLSSMYFPVTSGAHTHLKGCELDCSPVSRGSCTSHLSILQMNLKDTIKFFFFSFNTLFKHFSWFQTHVILKTLPIIAVVSLEDCCGSEMLILCFDHYSWSIFPPNRSRLKLKPCRDNAIVQAFFSYRLTPWVTL